MVRDVHTINARKMFPDLKSDREVTEKHLQVARRALASQIARRRRPPVAHNVLAQAVHNIIEKARK